MLGGPIRFAIMFFREKVAEVIEPLLFLHRLKPWIGGLRIQVRGSSSELFDPLRGIDPAIDPEGLLRTTAYCVAFVAKLSIPVDEQLVDNLYWFADLIALSEFDPTPLPGGSVATRTGLRQAVEQWYQPND